MAEKKESKLPEKILLSNQEIYAIVGLKEKAKSLKSFQFNYGLIRNIKEFEKITEALELAGEPSERVKEYREEKQKLIRKHAEKKGDQIQFEPLTDDQRRMGQREGNPVFKDPDKANAEIDKLYKKYQADLEYFQKQVQDANETIMNDSTEVPVYWIKGEHVPKKEISLDILYAVWPIIHFTEEDLKELEDKEE